MTDTVKLEMVQVEDGSSKTISRLTYEVLDCDRNTANAVSVTLAEGIVGVVRGWTEVKQKATGKG